MLPIFGPEGTRRGWISRRPWEGSPLNERFPRDKGRPHPSEINDPKALTYMDNDEPVQSWVGDRYWSTVVLVEDHISAMRVEYDADKTAIALLGTGINEEKVAEIQRHARHVLIALDSDATGQAFAHARKFGQAFDTCRVVILTQDIKDSNREMVRSLFAGR
jgi:5S rRNA maturation endonuclease (ribonuclease M5)